MPILLFPRPSSPIPPVVEDVGHRLVMAQLLDYDGSIVPDDPIALAYDVNWYDEWDGPGRGGCTISLSVPGSAELVPGRFVNCLESVPFTDIWFPRFTFMIEGNPEYAIVKRGEEHDEVITVQGRGWGALLDGMTIYPEYALNFSLETVWRLFSFASPLFPNAGDWGNAIELAEYLEGVSTASCYGHWQMGPDFVAYPAPIGFPYPTSPWNLDDGNKTAYYTDTFWIIPPDMPNYADPGFLFFRNEFELTDLTLVTFDATGDNFFTLFIEGVPILGEQINIAGQLMWQGWKSKALWLPAGTYTIAGAVYNISFTDLGGGPKAQPPCPEQGYDGSPRDGSPTGLLVSTYVAGDAINPPTPILMTNSTWVGHFDPTYWPGWYPSQVVDQLLSEGVARGSMPFAASVSYVEGFDSDGLAWRPFDDSYDRPDIPTIAFKVGSSVMQALQVMKEKGWIHWHVRPGTWTLDLFRGRVPDPPTSVADLTNDGTGDPASNLTEFTQNATAPYANALQVQWEGGTVVIKDDAAIAAIGRRVEAAYSSDAASEAEARLDGANELFIRSQSGYPALVGQVEPHGPDDAPYEGFQLGQYVTATTSVGAQVVRCLSITCREDPLGYAVWGTELNQKLDVPQRRTEQLLQQIGGKNQILKGVFD